MLANGAISVKVGLQGLTAQSTMKADLAAAAVTLKKAVLCNNMMQELRSKDGFDRVPLFIDNTSALHVAGHRTFSTRAKPIALTYFVQELVQEGTITIHHVKTQDQLADIGTKHPNKQPGTYQQNQGLWSLKGNEDLALYLGVFAGTRFCCVRRSTRQEH